MSTVDDVREILAVYTKRQLSDVPATGDLVDDFGLDSLDVAEVVTMLEEKVHLGDEAWGAFFEFHVLSVVAGIENHIAITPADVARYVDDAKAGKMPWLKMRGD